MPYIGKKPADIIATSVNTDTGAFSGNVTAGGTLGVTGAVTANAGVVVDNITIDGTEIDLSSGSLTVDVATDITLDAGGGNVIFKDDGASYMTFTNINGSNVSLTNNLGGDFTLDVAGEVTLDADGGVINLNDGGTNVGRLILSSNSGDLIMSSRVSDKDIVFSGNDGGSIIEVARFDMSDGGQLGIGTTDPTSLLHVAGDAKADRIIGRSIIESSSGFSSDTFAGMFLNTGNASGSHGLVCASKHADSNALLIGQHDTAFKSLMVKGNGRVFIGCTVEPSNSAVGTFFSPNISTFASHKMSCGSATGQVVHLEFINGNGTVGNINTSGTGTTFATSSDYRLKENVTTSWDATSRLKQLKPSRFNFIADANTTIDGFLAHEVSSIVPEAIIGTKDGTRDVGILKDADGNVLYENVTESAKEDGQTWTKTKTENVYQSIDQSKLVPLLTKALQEQQATIEALTARIVTLENA